MTRRIEGVITNVGTTIDGINYNTEDFPYKVLVIGKSEEEYDVVLEIFGQQFTKDQIAGILSDMQYLCDKL